MNVRTISSQAARGLFLTTSLALLSIGCAVDTTSPPDADGIAEDIPGNEAMHFTGATEEPIEVVDEASSSEDGDVAQKEQAFLGSDSCKDVNLNVINMRYRNGQQTEIDVKSFEYEDLSDDKWRSEGVTDRIIPYNRSEYWADQDLEYTKDDYIGRWKVIYRFRAPGGSWSNNVHQYLYPNGHTSPYRCSDHASYNFTVY